MSSLPSVAKIYCIDTHSPSLARKLLVRFGAIDVASVVLDKDSFSFSSVMPGSGLVAELYSLTLNFILDTALALLALYTAHP